MDDMGREAGIQGFSAHLAPAENHTTGPTEIGPEPRKSESIARKPGGINEHFATTERISW